MYHVTIKRNGGNDMATQTYKVKLLFWWIPVSEKVFNLFDR
nr:MAG TPA: hypothetical protein [Caudoviricetes sp.]